MTDKILWQSGDALNETNLAQTLALKMISGYVERGLSLSADWANNNFDVGSGMAVVRETDKAYPVFADARSGISLPNTTGVNYVYLGADISGDTVSIHVDGDDTAPSTPNIKLGELDASSQTVTEMNRGPDVIFDSITATTGTIDGTLTADSLTANVSSTLADATADTVTINTAADSANEAIRKQQLDDPNTGYSHVDQICKSPNVNFQSAGLGDGEGTQVVIKVADGETLTVYRWGCHVVSQGLAPSGFVIQLVDGSGNVSAESSTIDQTNKQSGVASLTNNTGSNQLFRIRVKNNTGTDYSSDDCGGHAAYVIE